MQKKDKRVNSGRKKIEDLKAKKLQACVYLSVYDLDEKGSKEAVYQEVRRVIESKYDILITKV